MSVRQFLRQRTPSLSAASPAESRSPSTFAQELNFQCGSIIVFASLGAAMAMLPFIPTDLRMFPGEPLIVALRAGLSIVGLAALVLHLTGKLRRYSLLLVSVIAA